MTSRRRFLQGLSLGALSPLVLPFMKYVSANDAVPMASRVVFVVEGNGVEPVNLLSGKSRAVIDGFNPGNPIGDARNFRSRYTKTTPEVVSDAGLADARSLDHLGGADSLESDAAVILGLSNLIAGGGHSSSYGALGCLNPRGVPETATIDCHLSALDAVRGVDDGGRGRAPFEALRLGIDGSTNQFVYGLSAYGGQKAAPILTRTDIAYQQLFGPVASGEIKRRFDARNKMLDFARRDVTRVLGTMPSSSPEYARLEFYLESLGDLRESYGILGSDTWRPVLLENLPEYAPGEVPPMGRPAFESPHPFDQLALHFELSTLALVGGLTNVAVLSCGAAGSWDINHSSLQFPNLQDVPGRHQSLHNAEGGGLSTPWAEYPRQVTRKNVELIARMARTLKAIPEGDGTMLDRTIIVYMSNNGASHHSSGREWPVMLVGGKKLGFQTDGRTVIYPEHRLSGAHRNISNLFNSLGHAVGAPLDDFGQETPALRPEAGPLSEVWQPVPA